ncbi:MAG TPA: serine/threonine-protein kinase [Pseudonocardiaceae bacterium]|nr:serine/threonine-protein kinase [Pseudonocardiaceae bacterium]
MSGELMDSGSVVFDRYRLEERIGAGGMGVVWKATDLLLDQPVALKRISLAGVDTEQAEETRARALREARTAARLRGHPHVVATYDVRTEDGDVWLVLEYLPSASLGELRREQGRLEIVEVARIGAGVADALAAGHAQGIVHRDVTPGNVLIAGDGTVKLTDFGISRLSGHDQITHDGVISGTIAYLAPEVAATGVSTPASDVFSLGSTLYAAIEGQPPFGPDDNTLRLLNVVRTGIIRPPTSAGALTSLLLRLLELDPATRPDAATTRDLLTQFAHRMTAATEYLPPSTHPTPTESHPPPPDVPTRWPPWPRRHRLLATVLALITLAALAAGTTLALIGGNHNVPRAAAPTLPSTVGPIALTGDPKEADPCALIDLAWLRQFGTPSITIPPVIHDCDVQITTPNGANAYLDVGYYMQIPLVTALGGQLQQLGELTIARRGIQGDWPNPCENVLVLADHTRVPIDGYGPKGFDECKLAEVGTATAINELARHGITYRPGRTAAWPITRSDACTLLTNTELTSLGGVDPTIRTPGYANWWCQWGPSTANVQLRFLLGNANVPSYGYGNPTTIADRRAWLHIVTNTNPHQCVAMVVSHPARSLTDATEMVQVTAQAAQPDQTLCTRATNLAAIAVTRVPTT